MQRDKKYGQNEKNFEIPAQVPQLLLAWYDKNARPLPWRSDRDPYHVWLSEIMLQQTGVSVVIDYYTRFLSAFPTIQALADASEAQVMKQWEGLGYYSRARNLMKTAQMVANFGFFPKTYEEIIKLPGVGAYTAGAIASICFSEPVPAVDGNVVRVIARLCGFTDPVNELLKKRMATALSVIYPEDRPGDFTQSLMELGAVVCVPNGMPKCAICPLSAFCIARGEGNAQGLPVKPPKGVKKQQALTVFLLSCGDKIALRQRENSGLLSGLWELPNVPGHLSDTTAVTQAAQWGVAPAALIRSLRRSHVFTHIKWDMVCYHIDCRSEATGFIWADRRQLTESFTLPTAFKKLTDELGLTN